MTSAVCAPVLFLFTPGDLPSLLAGGRNRSGRCAIGRQTGPRGRARTRRSTPAIVHTRQLLSHRAGADLPLVRGSADSLRRWRTVLLPRGTVRLNSWLGVAFHRIRLSLNVHCQLPQRACKCIPQQSHPYRLSSSPVAVESNQSTGRHEACSGSPLTRFSP